MAVTRYQFQECHTSKEKAGAQRVLKARQLSSPLVPVASLIGSWWAVVWLLRTVNLWTKLLWLRFTLLKCFRCFFYTVSYTHRPLANGGSSSGFIQLFIFWMQRGMRKHPRKSSTRDQSATHLPTVILNSALQVSPATWKVCYLHTPVVPSSRFHWGIEVSPIKAGQITRSVDDLKCFIDISYNSWS